MKKVILFLSIIGTTFLMTSCLGETSNNYAESSIVYITTEGMTTYGRTLSGRFIIAPQLQLEEPGSLHLMSYSWDEERDGNTQVGQFIANNVIIQGETREVHRTYLSSGTLPEVEEPNKFTHDLQPVPLGYEEFIGDFWVFEYVYKAREGESAAVSFYLDSEASDVDADEAVIDVHLEIVGEPDDEDDSPTDVVDIIALDMSQLRDMYEGTSETSTKRVKVQLRYYRENSSDKVEKDFQFLVAAD